MFYNLLKLMKYFIIGLGLLFLFHFESLSIGPLKVSHLWKGVLLIYLIFDNVQNRKSVNLLIYKPLLILAFLQLLSLELVENPFNALLLFGTTLVLPLSALSVLRLSFKKIQLLLIFFSSFFILCFIPYKLGFLESIREGFDLSVWGAQKGSSALLGPFQTVHSASTALAGSFLVVLYFWFVNAYNRIYLTVLLGLGFYFLISTYVRTGMVMVVFGSIPLFFYFAKKNIKTRLRLFVIGGLLSALLINLVFSNETLLDRIIGKRKKSSEIESYEKLGSGRGGIWLDAISIYSEANIIEKMIGVGETNQKKRMYYKRRSSIIPHNGFLFVLLNNGLIGLFFLIKFFRNILKYRNVLREKWRVLLNGFFSAYLLMAIFQNYDMYYMFLLFILIVAYTYREILIKWKMYESTKAIRT